MKRIKFDHTQEDVLKALGLTPEDAQTIAQDTTHPDCMKMRLTAAIVNGTPQSILNILTSLITDTPLTSRITENLEKLFNHFTEEQLIKNDEAVGMYNKDATEKFAALSLEEMAQIIIEEDGRNA